MALSNGVSIPQVIPSKERQPNTVKWGAIDAKMRQGFTPKYDHITDGVHPGFLDRAAAASSVFQCGKSGHDRFMRQHQGLCCPTRPG